VTTFYVSKTGNDSNDGSTPVLAKLTIGAGITAASNTDTVNIGAGTYSEEVSLGSLTDVIIEGATGQPEDVIITSTGSSATVEMYTDCTIKDLTVLYVEAAAPDSSGYLNQKAIKCDSSNFRVYHIDKCHISSNRLAVGGLADGSTVDRTVVKYVGTTAGCTVSGSAAYDGGATANGPYSFLGTYGPGATATDGLWTSCLFLNWTEGASYAAKGPFINCTFGFKTCGHTSMRGVMTDGAFDDNINNCISFMDSTALAASFAAGCSAGDDPDCGMRNGGQEYCISHGWNDLGAAGPPQDFKGYVPPLKPSDSYDTSDVTTAGGLSALYIDYASQNFRIRSGSLAYRTGDAAVTTPVYDLDGKPFRPGARAIGCYEYCFGHPTMGVSVSRQSGSLGVGSTLIGSMLGVAT